MIILRNFNRAFTITTKKINQFGNPKVAPLSRLEFPRGSIVHYLPKPGITEIGPSQNIPYLEKCEKYVGIRHHVTLDGDAIIGRPRAITTAIQRDILQYHRVNKRIRRLRDIRILDDNRIIFVENYSPLNITYTYPSTILSWYERWYNIVNSMISRLNSNAEVLVRQNYIFLNIPDELPSVQQFRTAERRRDNVSLSKFQNDDKLLFLELWTWLGDNRDASLFAKLTDDAVKNVNIVIAFRDRFVNLNLGELDLIRKSKNSSGMIAPKQMQMRLYKTVTTVATTAAEIIEQKPLHEMTLDEQFATNAEALGLIEVEDDNEDLEAIIEDIKTFDSRSEIDEDSEFEVVKDVVIEKVVNDIEVPLTLEGAIEEACANLIEAGVLTSREYQRIQEMSTNYLHLPNPYGEGKLVDMMTIKPESLKVGEVTVFDNDPTILDPSMLKSTMLNMDKTYNTQIIKHDIINSVVAMQKGGVLITNYRIDNIVDASGGVELHTVKIHPIGGEPSTFSFKIPIVDERGYWETNDIRYTMRKQRVDLPIRKTGPDTVSLTSFYGKNFIQRSEKATANYDGWLCNNVIATGKDVKNTSITHIILNNVFSSTELLPRDYTALSERVKGFTAGGYIFNFDASKNNDLFGSDVVTELKTQAMTPVATGRGSILIMDMLSNLYRKSADTFEELGSIATFCNIDTSKIPKEYTELSFMGKSISIGLIMCYYLGLEAALQLMKVVYRKYEPNERVPTEGIDLVLRMRDTKLHLEFKDLEQRLMFNGLAPYIKIMRDFTLRDFNKKDVYLNLIQKQGLSIRYLNELDLMDLMYIDPITERLLVKMNEPVTFKGLLRRSNQMLTYDMHPKETQMDHMHIYGNQRIAGAIYTEEVRAIRTFRNKPGSRKRIDIPSNEVWKRIAGDGAVLPAQDANPFQSIKEADVITFGGNGGRSRRSMVKGTRAMGKEELGVISGDTVDSGDVTITSYATANPIIEDVDGCMLPTDKHNLDTTQLISSAALLAPGALYDDDKRVNFIGIQHGSATFGKGYTPTAYRTGYEKVVAHRTGPTQANPSMADGVVKEITDTSIIISYTDPIRDEAFALGRSFGRHEGGVYPQELVTSLKVGDKVGRGDIINYNEHFFVPDIINPRQVNWKAGVMANTIMLEGTDTLEDSSAISAALSEKLTTQVTKIKNIRVKFDQAVHGLMKRGEHLDTDSILCTIEDQITASIGSFGEDSINTLRNLAAQTPKAGTEGFIDKIEIFYNGDFEDMSETILAIARAGDRERRKQAKVSVRTLAETGAVDSTLRIDGVPVELDTLIIRVYITHDVGAIGGDKAVFANQMKTTFRRVMTGVNELENGDPIDAIFGRKSVDDRIVYSVYKLGTTNKLCQLESLELIDILDNE